MQVPHPIKIPMSPAQACLVGASACATRAEQIYSAVGREPGRVNWRGRFIPAETDNLEGYREHARVMEEAARVLKETARNA